MEGQLERKFLSVPILQAYPLVKQYFPAGLHANILSQQLRDPALRNLGLDKLCRMKYEELRDLIRPSQQSTADAEAVEPSEETESESEAEERVPQNAEECVILTADEEGLLAEITLISPPEGIPDPGSKEMMRVLYKRKITRGVKIDFIERLVKRPIYDRSFRIAEAQLPVKGQDSQVTFHFDPTADLSPHVLEDGTVDYKELDFVKSVQAGELLCEITPATPGVDGMNIYGRPLPAMAGNPPSVRCGGNTVLMADGREIRAVCDGQVFLRGNAVEVCQVLILENVDFSTGNIDFPGSIHIQGDVSNGFTVKAEGDIVVKGVVENATLTAGGNIALCSGIKGGGNGSLEAGGDIRTLFIESCTAKAGGNIYADTILNSTVECGHMMHVVGKRGYLLGGVCVAGWSVSAVQIGNDATIATSVTLDRQIGLSGKDQLSSTVDWYYDTVDRMAAIAEEDAVAQGSSSTFPSEVARIAILSWRLEQGINGLQKEYRRPGQARQRRIVQVLETLYPNVSFTIDGAFGKNSTLRNRCSIYERQQKLFITEDRPIH